MSPSLWIVLGVAFATGASAALIVWVVGSAIAAVPPENRDYKDPPPLGFRLVWLPIQWLSHVQGRMLSDRARSASAARLRKAGLDYTISPAQFLAARTLAALFGALLGHWLLASFDGAGRFGFNGHAQAALWAGLLGWMYPALWLRDRLQARRRELLKALPFFLDIVTLCVEAGLNLQGAIQQAVQKGPSGVVRDEFQRVLRDIRAGKARADALRSMADRVNESSVTTFATAVIQAETMGMNLGPVLRAQADQRRSERFLRAERLAMEAPVKMLFPLIAFIFPCTFIVLFFPIVIKFLDAGL